jgi:hypothetical protein
VRDLVLQQALRRTAAEAAEYLADRIAAGEELPFEVVEEPGPAASMYRYLPLTGRFIREHSHGLRGLPAFAEARDALLRSELAERHLDAGGPSADHGGQVVDRDPAGQADSVILAFLTRLWEDSADFSLSDGRFEAAMRELEQGAEEPEGDTETMVPLIGLDMPLSRIQLPQATLIRTDAYEVPPEARASGLSAESDIRVVAVVRTTEGQDDPEENPPHRRFNNLLTALRLFKGGGVDLGPYAWTRVGEGRWRRIATGGARPRPGGYLVAEAEVDELRAFARALSVRPNRSPTLHWAINRFEMGAERPHVFEALSDCLLALRAALEGDGPAGIGVSMRVAALCAEPAERSAVKDRLDAALALERRLMSGVAESEGEDGAAVDSASEVEDFTRAILRDAAAGHLGHDLRATADEILLADGASVSAAQAGQQSGLSEYEPEDTPPSEHDEEPVPEPPETDEEISIERVWQFKRAPWLDDSEQLRPGADEVEHASSDPAPELESSEPNEIQSFDPSEIHESFRQREIAPVESSGPKEEEVEQAEPSYVDQPPPWVEQPSVPEEERRPVRERTVPVGSGEPRDLPGEDWLQGADRRHGVTLEWPAVQDDLDRTRDRPEDEESSGARVRHLFPVPDTTDWSVGELEYNREKYGR